MGLWTENLPPTWFPTAKATLRGWVNPDTNEVLVAIGNLNTIAGVPDVTILTIAPGVYSDPQVMSVTVYFNEDVVVTGAPSVQIDFNGVNRQAVYAGGSGTSILTFNYTLQLADAGPVTLESPINLNAGTIKDVVTAANVNLTFTPPTLTDVTVS